MRNRLVNVEFTSTPPPRQATAPPRPPVLRRSPDALYLHVPFCFHKCHYCDFYSLVESPTSDRQEAFTDALIAELRGRAGEAPLRPGTIFVGGGTPTLLRPDLWERLLGVMHELRIPERVTEFTVEANPETVTPELMRVLRGGGVNRVSMGAQSFQPVLLKALERWHDPASVPRAMDTVRAAGIENLNLDLIFAIPGQTPELLDADIDAAVALAPDHLSYYGLTYEPNTALTTKLRLGRVRPIEEDAEAQMFGRVLERLTAAGFEQYEVSNWAKMGPESRVPSPGSGQDAGQGAPDSGLSNPRRCRHNLAYWTNRDWLGVGPAAASHVQGWRWKNEPHLARYIAGAPTPPVVDVEHLDPSDRLGEMLMLRLRLRAGAEHAWLREHVPADDGRWSTIDELVRLALLERTDTHLRLTGRGLFVADAVIARLL